MIFYFDEAYHDPAITYKNNSINLVKNNVEEFYVGCYVGSDQWDIIDKAVRELEQRYRKRFSINDASELKSTALLKTPQLRYGLASLSNRTRDFYSELFEILSGKVKIHFSVLNKYEYLLRECFPNAEWFNAHGVNYQLFIYSFTKFMILHSDYDFPSILFSKRNNKWKIGRMADILEGHIEKISSIKKKITEYATVEMMIRVIRHPDFYVHSIPEKLHWSYKFSPQLFHAYCSETRIVPDRIYVDNEEHTLKALKNEFSCEVIGTDSKESVEIRICDWMAGFFSRMLLSYDNDYKNDNENDLTENIHFLDNRFFPNDDAFKSFMKLLYDLFICQQASYWATSGSFYGDQAVCFYTFLRYYDYCHKNNQIPNATDFNLMLIDELQDSFRDMTK